MTKVYGTGAYDFKRHHVAEYPVELNHQLGEKPVEAKPGAALPSSITLSEIQKDQLTMIASANWSKAGGDAAQVKKAFDPELVKRIYETELCVKEGQRKTVPLQRVMILEVSQYLENYLFPNFDPETATFEHVMSMILMVNEKFRENVAAWVCFHDRKDAFKGFLGRVLRLKSLQELALANIGSIDNRNDLSKRLSVLSPGELKDLVWFVQRHMIKGKSKEAFIALHLEKH